MCNPGTIREGNKHPKVLGAWVLELGFLSPAAPLPPAETPFS